MTRSENKVTGYPEILDLYCREGGAGMGYLQAGWSATGMDILNVKRRYPATFIQMDVTELFEMAGTPKYAAVHASPPCQAYSITKHTHKKQHPDLVAVTRDALRRWKLPYVIENVPGAPLIEPLMLCGTMFDLVSQDDDGTPLFLRRHRLFESNIRLVAPRECRCVEFKKRGWLVGGVYSGGSDDKHYAKNVRHGGYTPPKAQRQELMGIDWMTLQGLSQAVPPAYTAWIGAQLMEHVLAAAA